MYVVQPSYALAYGPRMRYGGTSYGYLVRVPRMVLVRLPRRYLVWVPRRMVLGRVWVLSYVVILLCTVWVPCCYTPDCELQASRRGTKGLSSVPFGCSPMVLQLTLKAQPTPSTKRPQRAALEAKRCRALESGISVPGA